MFETCTRAAGNLSTATDASRVLKVLNVRRSPFFGSRAQLSTIVCRGRDLKRRLRATPNGTTCVLEVNQDTFDEEVLQVPLNSFHIAHGGRGKLEGSVFVAVDRLRRSEGTYGSCNRMSYPGLCKKTQNNHSYVFTK